MMTGRDAPADLAEWKSRPAELSSQSLGRCVQLSEGGCVVERSGGGLGNAVVYTDAPVPVNHVWLVTVLATASRTGFREGLVSNKIQIYLLQSIPGLGGWSAECPAQPQGSSLPPLWSGQRRGVVL